MSIRTDSRGINIAGIDISSIPNFKITKVTPYDLPKKDIESINLALADGQIIVNSQWGERELIVEGYFQCEKIGDFDVARDALVEAINSKRDVAIEVWQSNAPRLYYGIVETVTFDSEARGVKVVKTVLKIKCSIPFGIDTTNTELLNVTAITDITKDYDLYAGGSAYSPIKAVMTLVDVTPATEQTITFTFDMGSEARQVAITWPFADGDVIVIDAAKTKVYVNTTEVEYVGRLPIIKGNTKLNVYTSHSDIEYNLVIDHKRRWL